MKKICLLAFSALLTVCLGQELVRNGGFEDSLQYWTRSNEGGTSTVTLDPNYDPSDPDLEVYLYQYYASYTRLDQTINVPGPLVRFSASAKLEATTAGGAGYYAIASIILQYLDSADNNLGSTMIYRAYAYTPQNTSTQHVIQAPSTNWERYEFLLADELTNLPGIDPAKVAKINIRLEAAGNGRSG